MILLGGHKSAHVTKTVHRHVIVRRSWGVTGDRYDAASRLDPDAASFRVNLGVDRATYEALFGSAPRQAAGHEVIDAGFDYTMPDLVMPHPLYAPMHWVCVVNPGERSRASLADLMDAAHALARARRR